MDSIVNVRFYRLFWPAVRNDAVFWATQRHHWWRGLQVIRTRELLSAALLSQRPEVLLLPPELLR